MYTRQQVLDWINEQRVISGAEPVDKFFRGTPMSDEHCVVANTFDYDNQNVLEASVNPNTRDDAGRSVIGPKWATAFPWGDLSYLFYHLECLVEEERKVALPLFVAEFAKDFDNGELPDLEDR